MNLSACFGFARCISMYLHVSTIYIFLHKIGASADDSRIRPKVSEALHRQRTRLMQEHASSGYALEVQRESVG